MDNERLYHISQDPTIKHFTPRVSPSNIDSIKAKVVFAISEKLLHNYLLPRDCPRIGYYAAVNSDKDDIEKFIGPTCAKFIVAVENKWLPVIQQTTLYVYELPSENFYLLDDCAGYYITTRSVSPLSVKPVHNILMELTSRNIELRFTPSLLPLAGHIKKSSLHYSMIRMRNI